MGSGLARPRRRGGAFARLDLDPRDGRLDEAHPRGGLRTRRGALQEVGDGLVLVDAVVGVIVLAAAVLAVRVRVAKLGVARVDDHADGFLQRGALRQALDLDAVARVERAAAGTRPDAGVGRSGDDAGRRRRFDGAHGAAWHSDWRVRRHRCERV